MALREWRKCGYQKKVEEVERNGDSFMKVIRI
jgi:hypothetical protein